MKIIFLDVDGVLNSEDDLEVYRKQNNITGCILYDNIEDRPLNLLQEIVDATGAKIVVSSSWRLGYLRRSKHGKIDTLFNKLRSALESKHLSIYDVTPYLPGQERGAEIQEWMYQCKENIENFIILDDDSDMGPFKESQEFIHTTYKHGLTEELKDLAIEILGTKRCSVQVSTNYTDQGTSLHLDLHIPYNYLQTFSMPTSCANCPVGYMQYDCGRNVPMNDSDSKERPKSCKLQQITREDFTRILSYMIDNNYRRIC